MRGRYLGQLGHHKLCVPIVVIGIPLSLFGTVYCFATTVAVDAFGSVGGNDTYGITGILLQSAGARLWKERV